MFVPNPVCSPSRGGGVPNIRDPAPQLVLSWFSLQKKEPVFWFESGGNGALLVVVVIAIVVVAAAAAKVAQLPFIKHQYTRCGTRCFTCVAHLI